MQAFAPDPARFKCLFGSRQQLNPANADQKRRARSRLIVRTQLHLKSAVSARRLWGNPDLAQQNFRIGVSSLRRYASTMKHDMRLQTLDFRQLSAVVCLCLVAVAANAVTANPYEAIVGRNVFGLKPPTVAPPTAVAPVPAAVTFKLLGISTILNRKQVLLKIKTAARPPEPAKEQSYRWSEGMGEDDIEVLAIDAANGIVTIKSHGETLPPLTMKEDAEKPAVGAALPGPAVVGQIPGLPAPANPSHLSPGGAAAVTTFGGGGNPRTIPTRTLRSSPGSNPSGVGAGGGFGAGAIGGGGATGTGAAVSSPQNTGALPSNLSPEAQAILIEAARTQIPSGGFDPLPKTVLTPGDKP
jgi:hypothetical protein